jgi:hypothetical protein
MAFSMFFFSSDHAIDTANNSKPNRNKHHIPVDVSLHLCVFRFFLYVGVVVVTVCLVLSRS